MTDTWVTRAETVDDLGVIREVNLAAFDTAQEADLVEALRDDPQAWIEGLSMVSVDTDGVVTGHALLTRCHIDEVPALCLGPCAVRPQRRRSGAGGAAIRSGLLAAQEMGEKHVVVLGHPRYYPRFGFTRASAHGIGLTIEVPDEALMVLSLNERPPPSGTVRYAAAFGI